MSNVAVLLSAFYCEEFLESRIRNLATQGDGLQILAVCLRGGAEESILCRFRDMVTILPVMTIPTIYGAWNTAISQTEADYLVVGNSDDIFYIGGIGKMQHVLDTRPDVALVYPDADICSEYDGRVTGRFTLPEFDPVTMLHMCYMGPMPMWRRSLHDRYGLFDSQMLVAGDYEFWLRTALQGEKFLHLPEVVGCYLSRKDGREHREPIRTLWETARARSRYKKEAYGPTNSQAGFDSGYSALPVARKAVDCD